MDGVLIFSPSVEIFSIKKQLLSFFLSFINGLRRENSSSEQANRHYVFLNFIPRHVMEQHGESPVDNLIGEREFIES
jgi:hypothetical protein